MENVFDLFKERGLIAQVTDEEKVRSILGSEKVTFYTGFDPTADSLHVGHFMQLIIMRHMQRAGHRPIVLLGGGTTMVGDPTGKTDMRKMLSKEQIAANAERFKNCLLYTSCGQRRGLFRTGPSHKVKNAGRSARQNPDHSERRPAYR